jgi:uncharacterized membrane protein YkoI
MNKKRVVAMVAGGTLAALGIAGTALAAGSDDATPRNATPSASSELSVSVAAAKEIAVRAAGGGFVESVEREVEHGRAVWDVDVLLNGTEHDIDVDAATGTVLRHRTEGAVSTEPTSTPTATGTRGSDDRPTTRPTERGDDHGGRSTARAAEPGDDHGGRSAEKGDDHGGRDNEVGDDHGGRGSEKDDDHGSGGHGSDD